MVSAYFGMVLAYFDMVLVYFDMVSAHFVVLAYFGMVLAYFGMVSAYFGMVLAYFDMVSAYFVVFQQPLVPAQPLDLANAFLKGITGGLDSDRTPGLGKSRFEVRPVDADDITAARKLINSATPSAGPTLSNHQSHEDKPDFSGQAPRVVPVPSFPTS